MRKRKRGLYKMKCRHKNKKRTARRNIQQGTVSNSFKRYDAEYYRTFTEGWEFQRNEGEETAKGYTFDCLRCHKVFLPYPYESYRDFTERMISHQGRHFHEDYTRYVNKDNRIFLHCVYCDYELQETGCVERELALRKHLHDLGYVDTPLHISVSYPRLVDDERTAQEIMTAHLDYEHRNETEYKDVIPLKDGENPYYMRQERQVK